MGKKAATPWAQWIPPGPGAGEKHLGRGGHLPSPGQRAARRDRQHQASSRKTFVTTPLRKEKASIQAIHVCREQRWLGRTIGTDPATADQSVQLQILFSYNLKYSTMDPYFSPKVTTYATLVCNQDQAGSEENFKVSFSQHAKAQMSFVLFSTLGSALGERNRFNQMQLYFVYNRICCHLLTLFQEVPSVVFLWHLPPRVEASFVPVKIPYFCKDFFLKKLF